MPDVAEKTILLDSARLYRVRTVLAILPATVDVSYLNPVEIRSGSVRLGWASVSLEKGPGAHQRTVYGDLCFAYDTPERLTIEAGGGPLFARLEGVISLAKEPFEVVGLYHSLLPEVWDIQIFGIELGHRYAFHGQPHLGEAVL